MNELFPYFSKSQCLSASLRLCASARVLLVRFRLIVKQGCRRVSVAGSGVQSAQEFALNVLGESSSLAASLDHLVGDLLSRCCNQVMRLEPQFRQETGQGLFAEIAFQFLLQD